MRTLKWVDKNFELVFMVILIAAMTIVMFVNIILRYIFKASMIWPDEFCRYTFCASVWLGCSLCIRERSSLRMDNVIRLLGPNGKYILNIIVDIITLIIFAILFVNAITVTGKSAKIGTETPTLGIPQAVMYGIMCFSFGMATLRSVQTIILRFIEQIKAKKGEGETL